MSINFFKLYAIRMISIILIFFTLLFIGRFFVLNMDKYVFVPIAIAIILSPKIKQVEFKSGVEIQLVWFGKIVAKLPK